MPYEEEYDSGKYDGEMEEMQHDDFCRKNGIPLDDEDEKEEDDNENV